MNKTGVDNLLLVLIERKPQHPPTSIASKLLHPQRKKKSSRNKQQAKRKQMLNHLPKQTAEEFPWSNIVPLCKEVDATDKEIIVHLKSFTIIVTTYLHNI